MKTVRPLWGQGFRLAAGLLPGVLILGVVFEAAAGFSAGVLIVGVPPHFPKQVSRVPH